MSSDGVAGESSTVVRAFRLLDLFDVDHPELTLAAMTARLGFNKATTYRLAQTLVSTGALEQDEQTRAYRLGLRLVQLGHVASVSSDVRSRAAEAMIRLREEFGETVYLLVPRENRSVCVHRLEGTRPIRDLSTAPGDSYPLFVGAGGLAMLSTYRTEDRTRILEESGLSSHDRATVEEQLAEATAKGYAVAAGDVRRSAGAVAAPIIEHGGTLAGALSVGGPRVEILERHDEMGPEVLAAAESISSWRKGTD